jgi:hypothetical protein
MLYHLRLFVSLFNSSFPLSYVHDYSHRNYRHSFWQANFDLICYFRMPRKGSFHWLPLLLSNFSSKTFWTWFRAWRNGEGLYQCHCHALIIIFFPRVPHFEFTRSLLEDEPDSIGSLIACKNKQNAFSHFEKLIKISIHIIHDTM